MLSEILGQPLFKYLSSVLKKEHKGIKTNVWWPETSVHEACALSGTRIWLNHQAHWQLSLLANTNDTLKNSYSWFTIKWNFQKEAQKPGDSRGIIIQSSNLFFRSMMDYANGINRRDLVSGNKVWILER